MKVKEVVKMAYAQAKEVEHNHIQGMSGMK